PGSSIKRTSSAASRPAGARTCSSSTATRSKTSTGCAIPTASWRAGDGTRGLNCRRCWRHSYPMTDQRKGLAVYLERSSLVMIVLGISAGLPFLLIFDTLSAWLRDEGLTLEVIGFFSLATLVYSFKFLWAPLVDRTSVPWLTARLGHRRSWMLACQLLIIVGPWLTAGTDPARQLGTMALFAVLVGFTSATQDI